MRRMADDILNFKDLAYLRQYSPAAPWTLQEWMDSNSFDEGIFHQEICTYKALKDRILTRNEFDGRKNGFAYIPDFGTTGYDQFLSRRSKSTDHYWAGLPGKKEDRFDGGKTGQFWNEETLIKFRKYKFMDKKMTSCVWKNTGLINTGLINTMSWDEDCVNV